MKKKLNIYAVVFNCILVFSILTVLQGIRMFDSVNRIWMVFSAPLLVFQLYGLKYNFKELLVFYVTAILHLIAFYFTKDELHSRNIVFYFLFWLLYYMFFVKCKDQILGNFWKSKVFYDSLLFTWNLLVGISAFLPSCYNEGFFDSFSGDSFRLLPATLIVIGLAMYMAVKTGNKGYNLYLIVPMYATVMGSSRTYLGVIVVFVLLYLYCIIENKRVFYTLLLPICVIIVLLVSMGTIAEKILSKFNTVNSYYDFWGTVTSGRTLFWKWDIEAFFDLPIWQQFVGNGFNFVYDVNGHHMTKIWAHNDFLNMLMNFGYIGLYIYFWVFWRMLRVFWPKGNQIPFVAKALFLGGVFINSMMNMSYTYLCATISYPLFLMVMNEVYVSPNQGPEIKELRE